MSTGPQSSLTILFEAPFWIGLYERTDNGKYEVCKITFGSEPKDYEVYEFLLKNWHKLKFSPPIQAEVAIERKINPKRMQREIQSQLQDKGIGTKAQQALKLQHEQCKLERKPRAVSRKRRRKTASLPSVRKRRKPSTEEDNMKIEWILCPFCGSKTRLKIRDDTVLENFPLYCPKCKHETLIAVRQLNLSIIQEPDAKTQSR